MAADARLAMGFPAQLSLRVGLPIPRIPREGRGHRQAQMGRTYVLRQERRAALLLRGMVQQKFMRGGKGGASVVWQLLSCCCVCFAALG